MSFEDAPSSDNLLIYSSVYLECSSQPLSPPPLSAPVSLAMLDFLQQEVSTPGARAAENQRG